MAAGTYVFITFVVASWTWPSWLPDVAVSWVCSVPPPWRSSPQQSGVSRPPGTGDSDPQCLAHAQEVCSGVAKTNIENALLIPQSARSLNNLIWVEILRQTVSEA